MGIYVADASLPDGCLLADLDGPGLTPLSACHNRPEGACERCWADGDVTRARWTRDVDGQQLCLDCAVTVFLEQCEGAFLPALVMKVQREFAVMQSIVAQGRVK
jgi:hypothetical protein